MVLLESKVDTYFYRKERGCETIRKAVAYKIRQTDKNSEIRKINWVLRVQQEVNKGGISLARLIF